jgi:hypothetical protein
VKGESVSLYGPIWAAGQWDKAGHWVDMSRSKEGYGGTDGTNAYRHVPRHALIERLKTISAWLNRLECFQSQPLHIETGPPRRFG